MRQINPLVLVMALCVIAEVALSIAKQPVPSIIDHVLLVLLAVLVPEERLQPTQTQSVTRTVSTTPPPEEEPKP